MASGVTGMRLKSVLLVCAFLLLAQGSDARLSQGSSCEWAYAWDFFETPVISSAVICPSGDGAKLRFWVWSGQPPECYPPVGAEARLYLTELTPGTLKLCPGSPNPVISYFDSNYTVEFILCGSVTEPCYVHLYMTCLGVTLIDTDWLFASYDLNGDGEVETLDFSLFSLDWLKAAPRSDFDGSGVVDGFDFSWFSLHWGHDCGQSSPQ